MRVHDGQIVSYAGDEGHDDLFVGDRGKVLVADGPVAHVLWSTGARAGEVTISEVEALSGSQPDMTVNASLDDSLEVGGLVAFSSRQVMDERGVSGLLDIMAEAGHLSGFLDIAEEAIGIVAHRIRHDASIRAITAELDDYEAEALVRTAAAALIRDAFSVDEEEA
jgi:hypothetical protein